MAKPKQKIVHLGTVVDIYFGVQEGENVTSLAPQRLELSRWDRDTMKLLLSAYQEVRDRLLNPPAEEAATEAAVDVPAAAAEDEE